MLDSHRLAHTHTLSHSEHSRGVGNDHGAGFLESVKDNAESFGAPRVSRVTSLPCLTNGLLVALPMLLLCALEHQFAPHVDNTAQPRPRVHLTRKGPLMAACSEANEGGGWSLGFRPFMQMKCSHIAGSEASGGITSLDSTTIDPALFDSLGSEHGRQGEHGARTADA